MNQKKLYTAARSEAFDIVDGAHEIGSNDLVETFIAGAHWLLSQPLSERLTEEEKERIRRFYKKLEVDYCHVDEDNDWVVSDAMEGLELIFGTDLFTNQTEELCGSD